MTNSSEKLLIKQKTQRSKTLKQKSKLIKKEIRLHPNELLIIQKAAKQHKKRITVFIKQAALAYLQGVYILPDDSQIKHFEQSLRQVSDAIHYISQKTHNFSQKQFQEIQDLITILETSLHRIFHQPQKLETLLEEIVKGHPHLHTWVKEQIKAIEKKVAK